MNGSSCIYQNGYLMEWNGGGTIEHGDLQSLRIGLRAPSDQ